MKTRAEILEKFRKMIADGVPIHIGGHSPAAARRAGRLGDGFLPLAGTPENLSGLRNIVEEEARRAGRDPDAIEVTTTGPADPALAKAYADAGVSRLIVGARDADLDKTRDRMGAFLEKARH